MIYSARTAHKDRTFIANCRLFSFFLFSFFFFLRQLQSYFALALHPYHEISSYQILRFFSLSLSLSLSLSFSLSLSLFFSLTHMFYLMQICQFFLESHQEQSTDEIRVFQQLEDQITFCSQ